MEKLHDLLIDNYYTKTSNNPALRIAVRAILVNEDDKIAYLHVKGEDRFGKRDHLESPGGGVDEGESLDEALKRELIEELGAHVEILNEVGYIDIEFNMLERIDRENYFICKLIDLNEEKHLLAYEKEFFKGVEWLSIDEAINFFKTSPAISVGNMIHVRERLVLEYIKDNNLMK